MNRVRVAAGISGTGPERLVGNESTDQDFDTALGHVTPPFDGRQMQAQSQCRNRGKWTANGIERS